MEGNAPTTNVSLDNLYSEPAVEITGGSQNIPNTPPVDAGNQQQDPQVQQQPNVPPVVTPIVDSFAEHLSVFNSPTISDEDAAVKQSVLDLFKANAIDTTGNLLNDKGEIVITADTLKEYINNDKLPLNENGDVVDAAGNVLKTANEIAREQSLVIEVRDALQENFGIEFDNVDIPDTTEGLIQLVQEAVEKKQVGVVRNFLDSIPELKSFYQHLAAGGTAEDYTTAYVDYSKVNVKTLSPDAKLALVRKSFEAQNNPMTDSLLELITKAGDEELSKATANALLYLDEKQESELKAKDELIKQQRALEQQETEKYWSRVEQIVNKGTIGNLQIPVQERKAFFDYMARPVDKNMNSAEAIASQNDSDEFSLMVSWLRYKGGDISKLVQNIAKTQKVQTLRERAAAARGTINGSGVPRTNNSASGNSTVSLESLLG